MLKKAVIIGDSIAEGHPNTHGRLHSGDNANHYSQLSYWIERWLPMSCINSGLGSDTTIGVLDRWDDDIVAFNPDYIFVNIGINDVALGYAEADIKSRLEDIIDLCENKGFIFSIPYYTAPTDSTIKSINNHIKSYCLTKNCKYIETYNWSVENAGGANYADSVHPSLLGYKSMAKCIIEQGLKEYSL